MIRSGCGTPTLPWLRSPTTRPRHVHCSAPRRRKPISRRSTDWLRSDKATWRDFQRGKRMVAATRSVPVVFTIVPDPVGAGFVDSLQRPGRNATGFMGFEYNLGAKWLELLKEIAPAVTRVAVLRYPALASGTGPVLHRVVPFS